MRRLLFLAAALVGAAVISAGPAQAITGEATVDTTHTYVGLVTFYDEDGVYLWRCTGTLISPTVVLTAGHCTSGAASARVYFETGPIEAGNYPLSPIEDRPPCAGYTGWPCTGGVTGAPYTYPGFDDFASFPDTRDVGVVVLSEPVTGLGTGVLVAADGSLDALATRRGLQDITFTVVGCGLQQFVPTQIAERTRYQATVRLVNLRSNLAQSSLQITNNLGKGLGGTCYGDSGGPTFYDNTNIIVALTSYGPVNCTGTGYAFRLDDADVLAWILSFDNSIQVVSLP